MNTSDVECRILEDPDIPQRGGGAVVIDTYKKIIYKFVCAYAATLWYRYLPFLHMQMSGTFLSKRLATNILSDYKRGVKGCGYKSVLTSPTYNEHRH